MIYYNELPDQIKAIKRAKSVLVPVHGKDDTLYARITKPEATWLVNTAPGNYTLAEDEADRSICIERRD